MILLTFSDVLFLIELSSIFLVMLSTTALYILPGFHSLLPNYFYTGNSSGSEKRYDLLHCCSSTLVLAKDGDRVYQRLTYHPLFEQELDPHHRLSALGLHYI